ncbi:MAG TPA: hypothetical protein VH723_10690 [Candidatus Limnocylindrales bacterium]|jgi:hypothetical protein
MNRVGRLALIQIVAAVLLALAAVVLVSGRQNPGASPGPSSPSSGGASPTASSVAQASPPSTGTPPPTRSPSPTPTPSPAPTATPALTPSPSSPGSASPTPTPVRTIPPTAAALDPGSVDRASIDLRVSYDVKLRLAYDSRAFTVDSLMTIENTSGGPIDRLELNTIAARLGRIDIRAASVASKAVSVNVRDQTLIMPLGGVLPDGGMVQARLIFRSTLRADTAGSNWMFARVNGVVDAYRWLPWVSKPYAFDRPNIGDPWITPVSPSVRVAITTDRPLVIATSGERVSASGLTQTFLAENVRDFAIAAAPDFRTGSAVVGDTTVRVYYRPGGPGSTLLAQAKGALAKMEALVGPYPYRTYRVAQSGGGYAIESPGLVWIPRGAPSSNLAYLVHHETAHQWFYGIVGGDQANEPFTDEAMADFLTRRVLGTRRASRCATARLDLSIYRYSNACYYEVVYIQGGNFIDDLRVRMGSSAFWAGVRAYIAENRFAIAPTKTLLDTLDAHTPLDLVPRFEPRFPRLY